jgi:glyoxylase-like metal-dependent hydrolase (beta-lactamase superfamily II)
MNRRTGALSPSKRLWFALVVGLGVYALSAVPGARQEQARGPAQGTSQLQVLPVRGNVYVLVGAGANITLSIGKEGALLVDAGTASMADNVVATVRELTRAVTASPATARPCAGQGCVGVTYPALLGIIASPAPPRPIQFIVNTNADPDHTGGNTKVAQSGTTFGGGPGLGAFQAVVKASAMIYAHENVLARMSAAKAPTAALPTETYVKDLKQFFNGEGIQFIHQPAAHRRHPVHRQLPRLRRRPRWQHRRRHRWSEPPVGPGDRRVSDRRRHAAGAGARPGLRRRRSGHLP